MADGDSTKVPELAMVEPPRAEGSRLRGVMLAAGLLASALAHLALVGTVLLVTPRFPAPVNSMPVDIVSSEEFAELAKKPAEPPKPPEPDKPAPASTPPTAPGLDPYGLPSAQPPPNAPGLGEAARLAQLLGLPAPMAGATEGGTPSEIKADLTPDEIAQFSAQVRGCWTPPAGLAATPKLQVVIRVGLRRDGSFASSPALLAAPASAQGPALVKAAMHALQQCGPYKALPAEKYDEWRLLDLRFSADGMASVAPGREDQRKPGQRG